MTVLQQIAHQQQLEFQQRISNLQKQAQLNPSTPAQSFSPLSIGTKNLNKRLKPSPNSTPIVDDASDEDNESNNLMQRVIGNFMPPFTD